MPNQKPAIQQEKWEKEFDNKFGYDSGFSDYLTPENAEEIKAFIRHKREEAKKEGWAIGWKTGSEDGRKYIKNEVRETLHARLRSDERLDESELMNIYYRLRELVDDDTPSK